MLLYEHPKQSSRSPWSSLRVTYGLVSYHCIFVSHKLFTGQRSSWMIGDKRVISVDTVSSLDVHGEDITVSVLFLPYLLDSSKRKEQRNFINQHAKSETLPAHQVCPYSQQDHAHLYKMLLSIWSERNSHEAEQTERNNQHVCLLLIKLYFTLHLQVGDLVLTVLQQSVKQVAPWGVEQQSSCSLSSGLSLHNICLFPWTSQ